MLVDAAALQSGAGKNAVHDTAGQKLCVAGSKRMGNSRFEEPHFG